jgi:hypothetical protein
VAHIHVPDHLILPFGTATKSDIQRIVLSSVAANGLYLAADVPIVYIDKSKKRPLRLENADSIFDQPKGSPDFNEGTIEGWMACFKKLIRGFMPNPTKHELLFLEHYFDYLPERVKWNRDWKNVFNALLPIPEMQVYVHDPLADQWSFEPNNNFRVDFGFWTGEKLIAIEIDGGEPEGYARDVRRDRMLRRADIDVVHILNFELEKHGKRAIRKLLPDVITDTERKDFTGMPPDWIPF